MIKMIALDLDGTTLNSDHKLAEETKAALQEAMAQGVIVTIATGRMLRAAKPFAEELGIRGPIITYNGSLIADAESGEKIKEFRLDFDIARRLLQIAREKDVLVQTYIDDMLVVDKLCAAIAGYCRVCNVPAKAVGRIEDYWQSAPTKLLYVADAEILAPIWQELKAEFGDSVYITKSAPFFLEIINPAANKGAGVRSLAEHYGIAKDEIMVCGDSLNDMELFDAAGLKIAMGNAEQALKDKADFITLTNDEHGVAYAVKKFVLD